MTLMPVTRIALSVDWSTNSGASAWIGARRRCADRAALVDRLADDVEDAAERLRADRHADLRAGVGHVLAAGQALGRVHRDGADGVLAEMLRDFEHEAVAVVVGLERGQDRRQLRLSNVTSTTAPMTWLMRPTLLVVAVRGRARGCLGAAACGLASRRSGLRLPSSFLASNCLERFGARDDFDQFGGDRGLAGAVILDRQLA